MRLDAGVRVEFPQKQGRDLYFYVFSGCVVADKQTFAEGEQGLHLLDDKLEVEAQSASMAEDALIGLYFHFKLFLRNVAIGCDPRGGARALRSGGRRPDS